ncbi:RNA helicase [Bertholletia excelsa]
MSILQMSLSIPKALHDLSSSRVLSGPNHLSLTSRFSQLSINTTFKTIPIRMGGGPRTYPGGVSKWQWKRMQAKKAKQLLKARLARERQIYEMRKRAELKAAVSELERPWEVVEKGPKLFSVSADEQVKVLADRFQRPGGFDMWSEKDGPQLFTPVDGLPSSRFFPKGVVHSIKPYGRIEKDANGIDKLCFPGLDLENEKDTERNGYTEARKFSDCLSREGRGKTKSSIESSVDRDGQGSNGRFRKKRKRRFDLEDSRNLNGSVLGGVGLDREQRRADLSWHNGGHRLKRDRDSQRLRGSKMEVHDMSLQHDGSYGIQAEN